MDVINSENASRSTLMDTANNAQKSYEDVYSALDASVAANNPALSVGVDVEIGKQPPSEPQNSPVSSPRATTISISNVAQATVAPELRDLRAGQELHNRLQVTNAGLESIKESVEKIAEQIDSSSLPYAQNTTIQDAINDINSRATNTTYSGEQVFSLNKESQDIYTQPKEAAAVAVSEASETFGVESTSIQSTIIANAQRVALNDEDIAATKGTETFIISKSNSSKLYSFPKETPLDKINEIVEDTSTNPAIKPLIHFENNGSGELAVVTREEEGPTAFETSLTVSALDGELFAVPLETYSKGSSGTYQESQGAIVSGESPAVDMSESVTDDKISKTISFENSYEKAESDAVMSGEESVLLDKAESFSERLGEDVREGDGFAMSPVDPGASSGSLTAGSQLRDSSKSTNRSNGFNGSSPEGSDDVMLLPEEEDTERYLTMQEREAGLSGNESLDQASQVLGDAGDRNYVSEVDNRYVTMQQREIGVEGSESLDKLARMMNGGEVPAAENLSGLPEEYRVNEQGVNSGLQSNLGLPVINGLGHQVNSPAGNVPAADSAVNEDIDIDNENNQQASTQEILEGTAGQVNSEGSGEASESEREVSEQGGGAQTELPARDIEYASGVSEAAIAEPVRDYGVNPLEQLESIENVLAETMSFTIQGNRGEMDFVIAAGVRTDALSLAINRTAAVTGVTASAANGRIALSGAKSSELRTPEVAAYNNNDAQMQNQAVTPVETSVGGSELFEGDVSSLSEDFAMNIDLSNLGRSEGRNQNYNLTSFAQEEVTEELEQTPELAGRILQSSLREIDALQSNIESLSSVNLRNTLDATERIEEKIIGRFAQGIQTTEESEEALSRVSVGISNSTSAEGGRGFGTNPLASLNLLASVESTQTPPAPTNGANDALSVSASRFASAQTSENSGVDGDVDRGYVEPERDVQSAEAATQEEDVVDNQLKTRLTDGLERAREGTEIIREVFEVGRDRREFNEELIADAEQSFMESITGIEMTVRELGREYEGEAFDKAYVENMASDKLYQERQEQLGLGVSLVTERTNDLLNPSEAGRQMVEEERVAQEANEFDQVAINLGPQDSQTPITTEGDESIVSGNGEWAGTNNDDKVVSAPAAVIESGSSVAAPVATTSSAQESVPQPSQNEANAYKSMSKLFEGKLGTITVRGQDYSMKDLESSASELMDTDPDVVESVLDRAFEEINKAIEDIAVLDDVEIEAFGSAMFAALDTYGSDQSATTPEVGEHAAYVRA